MAMEFCETQIGQVIEQIKQSMLAHTPVVYIPTDQMEFVSELLFDKESLDSFVPRVYSASKSKSEFNIEKLQPGEFWKWEEKSNTFVGIVDNYEIDSISQDSGKIPSVFVSFAQGWDNISANVVSYIKASLGIKKAANYLNPQRVDFIRRSLYIVVTPVEEKIPAQIAPYVKTVKIPALTDREIEFIIETALNDNNIDLKLIDTHLMNQMIVSFRGMGSRKIKGLLDLMISCQALDFDYIDSAGIMNIIRSEKKQMLDSCSGLKWEKSSNVNAAGLESITLWLKSRKSIFADPELAKSQHMDIPNGILISGIPGSGKSLMAKTASSILDMPLISLDMGALLGGLMGESEHNMINALTIAEQMAPCILWIDEIEKGFSGSSQGASQSDGGVGRRMFGKFLTWMQEKSAACFVIATSNDITSLPPELFRSERFDRKFFTFMPTAEECADIFASIIRAQNIEYEKKLKDMPMRMRLRQAKQLFASVLETEDFWIKIINECCSKNKKCCELQNINENMTDEDGVAKPELYLWKSSSKPKNKLMTGADISALIKEAKFIIHPSPVISTDVAVIYGEQQMANAVRNIMMSDNFKPYGETNLKDIVKCFRKLYENEFVPASGHCIVDFNAFDDDRKVYMHNPSQTWDNDYDRVLYCTIVGAINHYSKEIQ